MEQTTPRAEIDTAQAIKTLADIIAASEQDTTTAPEIDPAQVIGALQLTAEEAFIELRDLHAMLDLKADQLSQIARDVEKMRQQIEQALNRLEGRECLYYNARTGRIQK
jgi:aminoglycoside phosphotransferase family enzyme